MKVTCYPLQTNPPPIRPGRMERDWMEEFSDRHPYRCLPMSIANCTGWEIVTPAPFRATWNGGPAVSDVTIESAGNVHESFVKSMFARGTLTFLSCYLFRTDPGWDMWVGGAPNWIKHGIQPLTGIVETSWLPMPFTMNWHFTQPGTISFEKDEPFCFIMPTPHNLIDECTPELKQLKDEPELEAEVRAWAESRNDFSARLEEGDSEARRLAWQRTYFQGKTLSGEKATDDHVNKRRLAEPHEAKDKE